jgi:hypothetical protein
MWVWCKTSRKKKERIHDAMRIGINQRRWCILEIQSLLLWRIANVEHICFTELFDEVKSFWGMFRARWLFKMPTLHHDTFSVDHPIIEFR